MILSHLIREHSISVYVCFLWFLSSVSVDFSIFYNIFCSMYTKVWCLLPLWMILFLNILISSCLLLVYKMELIFKIFVLHYMSWPSSLISFRIFLVGSLGVSTLRMISSENRGDFISSFPISLPFISFSCLMVLARTSS